jgi:hypothetical protein
MSEVPRIAYLLLVHKNPSQVNRLIQQLLAYPQADVFIHIDKKYYAATAPLILKTPRVRVIDAGVDVTWGDISQIDATLRLMRAMRQSEERYDFAVLRSGQDLVVRKGLPEFLSRQAGKNFIQCVKQTEKRSDNFFWSLKWPRLMRNRYDSPIHPLRILRSIVIRLHRFGWTLFPNPVRRPRDFVIYWGSQWFCLAGSTVEYIVDFVTDNPWFYAYFEHALVPDGAFFQTLLMNSPLASTIIDDDLTFLEFGHSFRTRTHARTLTCADIPQIESSAKFFARKFDPIVDSRVIDYFCGREPVSSRKA